MASASTTTLSSGKGDKTCPVCLRSLRNGRSLRELGKPKNCDHFFCLTCILEWSKNVNTCPVDRLKFNKLEVFRSFNQNLVRTIDIPDCTLSLSLSEDVTYCEICNQCNREDQLLLCDGCDKGYHLDCLTPPLSTVPEGDWYCRLCEPIVRAQYTDNVITLSSAEEQEMDSSKEEGDKDYRPYQRILESFELDLSSSEIDITGSERGDEGDRSSVSMSGSETGSLCSLRLDSEPDSDLESESDAGLDLVSNSDGTSSCEIVSWNGPPSVSSEDSLIDVTDVPKPLTSDPLLPTSHKSSSTSSRDPLLPSRTKNATSMPSLSTTVSMPSSSATVSSKSSQSFKQNLDPLQSRNGRVQKLQKVGSECETEEYVDIESTDSEVVKKKRKSSTHSNLDFTSPSTSDASCIDIDRRQRRKRHRAFFRDSDSEDDQSEGVSKADDKGKGPVLPSKRKVAKRKASAGKDSAQSLHNGNDSTSVNGSSLPVSERSPSKVAGDELKVLKCENTMPSDSSPLRLPESLKWPDEDESLCTRASTMDPKRENPQQQRQQKQQLQQQQQHALQRKNKQFKRKKRVFRKKSRRRRKRKRKPVNSQLRIAQSFSSTSGFQEARSRARTAATHTPRKNTMREAVRESYRHDNLLEGLEWARAILTGSVVPHASPRKSNFLQNFPTPVSGYVPRHGRKSEDSRQDDTTSSTVNRLYGFTPSRQLVTRPVISSREPTPTANSSRSPLKKAENGCMSPRDHRVSAEVQRRLPTRRRRNLSQVLVTPVKLDGLGARSPDTDILRSSNSRQIGGTSTPDILGEMCKGLEVLENRNHTIRRDGSIVPKGNDTSVMPSQDDKHSPHLFSPSSTVDKGKKRDISEGVDAKKKNSRTGPSNKSLSSVTSSSKTSTALDEMSSSAGSSVNPDKQNRLDSVDVKRKVRSKLSDDSLKDEGAKKRSSKSTGSGAAVPGAGQLGSQPPPPPISSQPKKLCGYTIPKLSCPTPTPLLPTPNHRSPLLETPKPPFYSHPPRKCSIRSSSPSSSKLGRGSRAIKKRRRVKSVESERPQSLSCGKRRRDSSSSVSSTSLPLRSSKPPTKSIKSSQPIPLMETKFDFGNVEDSKTDIREAGSSKLEQPVSPMLDALNTVNTPKVGSKLESQEVFIFKVENRVASGHELDPVLSLDKVPNGIHSAPDPITDPLMTLQPYDPEDTFDAFDPEYSSPATSERCGVNTESISPPSDNPNLPLITSPLAHPASGHSSPAAQVDPKTVIRRTLDRYFDKGTITNRQYKRILERATRKVQQGFEKIPIVDENKVKKLVSDYVHAYKTEVPFLASK